MVVFFFKQRTAYEVRISDGSSDVCSSDLAAGAAALVGLLVAIPAVRIRGVTLAVVTLSFAYALDQLVFNNKDLVGLSSTASSAGSPSLFGYRFGPLDQLDEIGRAHV